MSKIHTHSCCCTWVVSPKLCTRFPNLTTIDTTTQGHNCYFVLILSVITGQIDKVYSQCMVIQTSRSRICGIKERESERERMIQQEKEEREGKGVNESGREKVSLFDIFFIGCRSTTGNPVLWKTFTSVFTSLQPSSLPSAGIEMPMDLETALICLCRDTLTSCQARPTHFVISTLHRLAGMVPFK